MALRATAATLPPPPPGGVAIGARPRRPGTGRTSLTRMVDEADVAARGGPVEIEWQFDALDLRPVERWLAALPVHSVADPEGGTVTALARPPRRLVDTYLDTSDWHLARAGFVLRTRKRGRQEEVTLKDTRPGGGQRPAPTPRGDRTPASGRSIRARTRRSGRPSTACRRRHTPAGRGAPGAHPPPAVRVARGRRRRGGGRTR